MADADRIVAQLEALPAAAGEKRAIEAMRKTMPDVEMVLPAGTQGLVMKGQAGGEREIMLNANSVFRIDRVEHIVTGGGTSARHVVHVTYMGTREDA